MKSSGVVRSAAVTREVRTDSLRELRHVVTAEGVNGAVMDSKDSLVAWDFRAVAAASNRMRGDGESSFVGGKSTEAFGASEDANRSHRMIDVCSAAGRDLGAGAGMLHFESQCSAASPLLATNRLKNQVI